MASTSTRHLARLDYSVLQQCMHCGMCLPTCPTYDATSWSGTVPRGRIALMRAIADGELGVTRAFGEEMYYCLGCLACMTRVSGGGELRGDVRGGAGGHRGGAGCWPSPGAI